MNEYRIKKLYRGNGDYYYIIQKRFKLFGFIKTNLWMSLINELEHKWSLFSKIKAWKYQYLYSVRASLNSIIEDEKKKTIIKEEIINIEEEKGANN